MQLISTVCTVIMAFFGLLFAYRLIFILLGLFKTKCFPVAKKQHRYAIVISARNEEAVIGNLIDSIKRQDYPGELITTFVVADNCTDQTAKVARDAGAICYERFDEEHRTKGFALQFLFAAIERDYQIASFDGYFVFDADNLLKKDYISRMNDAFDAGQKVVTSYRNTKNFDSNFISAGYALHWLRTTRFEFRARSFLGVSTWIQGCGFLFSSDLVKDGWHYTSLTEDRAFSIDVIAQGITISYQHEAQFYDEQPTRMRIAMRQRIRWAKGHLEAFRDYAIPLLKGMFRGKTAKIRLSCYDMFMMTIPYSAGVLPIKLLNYAALSVIAVSASTFLAEIPALLFNLVSILIFEHFGVIPMAIVLFFSEKERIPRIKPSKIVFYIVTYPLFSMIGYLSTWIALFKRVTWQPIPHDASINIDQIEHEKKL